MEEVCGKSIPQLEQGCKRAWGSRLITNRFLGEWTYILGLAAGWCRGANAPSPHAGVFGKGKRVKG